MARIRLHLPDFVAMVQYPALVNLTTQTVHSIGLSESFLVGRNDTADVCVLDVTCSRHHFRIVRRDGRHVVEPLNALNPTYREDRLVKEPEALSHGDIVQAGQVRFQFLMHAAGADTVDRTRAKSISAASPDLVKPVVDEQAEFPLAGAMLIGRDSLQAQIVLPHPQVSRHHARIDLRGPNAVLTDLGSANGTYVNGQRIQSPVTLAPGAQLDIGPFALQFTGTALIPRPRADNIEVVARGVTRTVRSRDTGLPLTLLDGINLVIRPREFVCLLGPSGSGKSTLLAALSGRAAPDDGEVLLNAKDLHANFDALKQDIALVPQKDVLHDSLAVGQALWYTARLRLPPDTTASEIESSLREMLDTVGLTARRGTTIRHLSGGQVKRASLANEILCKPSLLFLDEVTSGLDEQTDREVMNLCRSLADAGKTVVCITHSLANVETTCHLVVILTAGGKLAFVGKPTEALDYFRIARLGDVYERLAEQPPEHWQREFLKSPHHQRYITDRLPAQSTPRLQPSPGNTTLRGKQLALVLRQTLLLAARYAAIWRGDYLSLLAMAAQAMVVAVLLGALFGNLDDLARPDERAGRAVNLMFLLAVSSFWFGCNNAAKEIVKERTIYTRERDFNVRISSYYASKLILLCAFSWLQTVLLFGVVRIWCHPPGDFASELVVLLALALAGATVGLAISALATTEEMAITLIPMVVIPQIILSGTIAPLGGVSKAIAVVTISTYWGKRGLDTCLTPNPDETIALPLLALLLHASVGIACALLTLQVQNLRNLRVAALLRLR